LAPQPLVGELRLGGRRSASAAARCGRGPPPSPTACPSTPPIRPTSPESTISTWSRSHLPGRSKAPRRAPLAPAPGRNAVRDYVELLASAYFLLSVYFWRSDSDSAELSKDKKLYFGDPLLHTVAHDVAPGLAVDRPALIENAVALALYRRYEAAESQLEGFDAPAALHVWQTRRAGEIDFVCGSRTAPDLVEVKYRSAPDLRQVAAIPRAFPGRPVAVATKDRLERRDAYALVPASLLLWALG
jgi:predicted AAA+ superfamily ATPase